MAELFELNALQHFKCLGSDCPRTCCGGGWNIEIEAELIKKWNLVDNKNDRQWLQDGTVSKADAPSKFLKMDDTGECAFLDDQKLCAIQCKYGHEFIPKTCQIYPRLVFESPRRVYKTATMSCPEIVRLIFSSTEKYSYTKSTSTTSKGLVFNASKEYYEILVELDNLIQNIISVSHIKRGVRLFFISVIFSEAFKQLSAQKLTLRHLQQTRKNHLKNLSEINAALENDQLKPDPVTSGSFWKVIYELSKTRSINPKYLEKSSGLLTTTITGSGNTHQDYIKIHQVICDYSSRGRELLNANVGEIIETYLKIYFVTNGYPLSFRSDKLDIMLVQSMIGLCLLQLLLWMQVSNGVAMTRQLLEETIVEVHRRFVHSNTVTKHLQQDQHMRQISAYCSCFLDLF